MTEATLLSTTQTAESNLDTQLFDATRSVSGLCSTFDAFLYNDSGRKAVVGIYSNRATEDLESATQTADELALQPPSVTTLTALYAFLEKYIHITPEQHLQQAYEKNIQDGKNIWVHAQSLYSSTETLMKIILLYCDFRKRNSKNVVQLTQALLQMPTAASLETYIDTIWQRLDADDICITHEVQKTTPIDTELAEELKKTPLEKRFRISHVPPQTPSLMVRILSDDEVVYIVSPNPKTQPVKIAQKGEAVVPLSPGSVIKIKTAKKTELLQYKKDSDQLIPLRLTTTHPGFDTVLQLLFQRLWEWHTREFEEIDANILIDFCEVLSQLSTRKNTGALKSTLRSILASIEQLGFPRAAHIEIMDKVAGLNGRGIVLDQSCMSILEAAQLTQEQWEYIFNNGRDTDALIRFFQDEVTQTQQGPIARPHLSEIEKKYLVKQIESTPPGHNIASMAQLFSNNFPLATKLHEQLAAFCYQNAARATENAVPFDTFAKQAKDLIQRSTDYTESEITNVFEKQHLVVCWLHARVTKNFSRLAMENLKKVTALSITDTVKVSEIPTPRLRYDLEQKALIMKASLAETLPPELHQYIQLKTLQGSFDREYCLNIEKLPNHAYLESLLLAELNSADKKRNFIPGEKIKKALFRFHIATQSTEQHAILAKRTINLAARMLAHDIQHNPNNDIIRYLQQCIISTSTYIRYSRDGNGENIFTNETQLASLCRELFLSHASGSSHTEQRFQRMLTSILWKIANTIHATKKGGEVIDPTQETAAALFSLFSQAEVTVEGFHGWGANDETLVPFVQPLATELDKPALFIANNYMGASGSNKFVIPGQEKPLSLKSKQQDMDDYGRDLVELLAEIDGVAHDTDIIAGHSMGGLVTLRAALDHAEEWKKTLFLALEPVISTAKKEIPDPDNPEKLLTHYISLLGATAEETRKLSKKIAAIITKLVTSPEDLPERIQNALVYLGRIKVNATVYNQLVENSDPRVALAHYMELITNRVDFHTHVTPILQENEALTTEEKIYLATQLKNQVRIVIAQNDDVLKHAFALWELLEDPKVPPEHQKSLAAMLLIIMGNHYGHLENKSYPSQSNPENLPNNVLVAKLAASQLNTTSQV